MSAVAPEETKSCVNETLFDAWAQVYDHQSNPLLLLEERFLESVLPDVQGRDIVDAGCGTGRWLARLSALGARTLVGIDSSECMLDLATAKKIHRATLHKGTLPHIPVASASVDLALSSFTLSYVDDLDGFAYELSRVLRYGADAFITDMHPQTATTLGWHRGIRVAGQSGELQCVHRPIDVIVHAMAARGLQLCGHYEPPFGDAEFCTFVEHGKESEYERSSGLPAIVLLHFKRMPARAVEENLVFRSARVVLGATESIDADLRLQDGCIANVTTSNEALETVGSVDLSGFTVFPGLVNPHDHLDFSLFPRLGHPPYRNYSEWAEDIQKRYKTEIDLHKQVPVATRLWWGAIRNLLCGVTTVCHHNPHDPTFDNPAFPIRLITEFGWAHSLAFQRDLQERHQATAALQPFIVHACEGVDADAHAEFEQLHTMGVLGDGTVLVHGLAMDEDNIAELNRLGASLIRCPSSNKFLFDTVSNYALDESVVRLAIGSDSPLTATGDFLDELRFCREEAEYPAEALFRLSYRGAPQLLGLETTVARLMPGGAADFFAVAFSELSPAERLCSLSWKDIELVVIGGSVRVVSDRLIDRLPQELRIGLECLVVDGVSRWIKAPVKDLLASAEEILGANKVSLNGRLLSVKEP